MPQSQTDPDRIITTANDQADVAQIIYGLSIRGVHAKVLESPSKQGGKRENKRGGKRADKFQIVLESPTPIQLRIAKESIASIWDAILDEYERAVTLDGHCSFCRYDVAGLPRPTTCPECGVNLDSIDARRAMRDGRKP